MSKRGKPVFRDSAVHNVDVVPHVIVVPPGAGKTKLLADMLARYGSVTEAFEAKHYRPAVDVPRFCELLFCFLVEPEFQEDRLADYRERFDNIWVPKFGRSAAVVFYVWHVLRQSRLIDWLIRALSCGSP